MKLLTRKHFEQLLAVKGTDDEIDFKLFDPCGAGTWLLTEIEPDDPDIAWGLCDLGMGCPEFGTMSLAELAAIRGRLGLGIERDLHFAADRPISAYIAEATRLGHIQV